MGFTIFYVHLTNSHRENHNLHEVAEKDTTWRTSLLALRKGFNGFAFHEAKVNSAPKQVVAVVVHFSLASFSASLSLRSSVPFYMFKGLCSE
jgi:hypothetical protein